MKLEILNPVALKVPGKGSSAPRLPKLDGKLIGLYWNRKAGGDAALKRVGELLRSRYPGVETRNYVWRSTGDGNPFVTRDDLRRIAQECAAVVGSTAE